MIALARFRIVLAAACLMAAFTPACAQAPAAAITGPCRVAGTVVNAVTGEPVRGALVALLSVADSRIFATSESGDDGHFALDHLPAAKFQLTVSKRGYSTSFYDQHEEYNSAIVTGAGQETGDLIFKLAPAAVLSGVITGDGGDAIEGATVMLFKEPQNHDPGAKVERVGLETTDDTGAYEFADLTAGTYLLAVQARPWYAINRLAAGRPQTEAQAALDVAYPVTFFDSTTDATSATPIVLTGGTRQEANVSLHAVPALHLEVAAPAKTDGGAPVPQLRQWIFGVNLGSEIVSFDPSRNGMIRLDGVAPGQYELTQGDPPRVLQLDASASQQVDPNAGVPTVAVTAVLCTVDGAAFSGATSAVLAPEDGGSGNAIVATRNGSTFSFPQVPPGAWSFQVEGADGPLAVLSIAAAGKAQAGDRVTVRDQPLSLLATVSTSTARIEGFARKDGRGFAGAMVVLVPKDPAMMAVLARRDQSDSDGSFALLRVAPGAYTVVAIEKGWDLDWASPAVMARYLPAGEAVTVKDGISSGSGGVITLAVPVTVQAR